MRLGYNMTIGDLLQGDVATVVGYLPSNHSYRSKLLALGMTRGTQIEIINIAPLGDPLYIGIRGSCISLRKKDADIVLVDLSR